METHAERAAPAPHTPQPAATGYRWVVLAVGTAAQATVSAVMFSVAVLAPEIRAEFGLSLGRTGVVLAAVGIGMTPALLPWGLLTDRVGERLVLPLGLGLAAPLLTLVGSAGGYAQLVALLALIGALIGSANAASGRAVMQWFAPSERGLALGIRQSSVPLGGLVAAVALPPLVAWAGLGWAYVALGAACAVAAVAGAVLLRSPSGRPRRRASASSRPASPLRRPALWVVSSASGLLIFAQTSTMSFTVLFLSDGRGMSSHAAALVLAAQQVVGVILRVGVGHWSDRRGSRIVPLQRLTLGIAVAIAVVAAAGSAPLVVLVPVIVVAGGVAMSWNGLSFVSAAEIAGLGAAGAALGLQQTMLGVAGIIAPIVFASVVARSSWSAAYAASALFPVASWLLLRPLSRGRAAR